MSVTYIWAELRQLVIDRAEGLCEYCLIHEEDTYLGCQVDHIISEKHRGPTTADNLAYACVYCNRNKGSDIGSVTSIEDATFYRFFNPRIDLWYEHFSLDLDGAYLLPISNIGRVTERILGFNQTERVIERQLLLNDGRYPTPSAAKRMQSSSTTC